ncbi:ferric reductase-like transmembrane domain-containing protein [Algibacter sp. L4_22]|uniref:ferredoxin reductase family protein n=1 Tax=Algibacter sp. L4_22 TaxID=2942477 RepID=UPI00201B9374|nr:ferric reductase-like transmembrane domain-containing protein [Algibacter sp. L4_22]MCL5128240.1 ferric reductase-like transmembrane domain-containing protein [Algibacter sp. L4_22]
MASLPLPSTLNFITVRNLFIQYSGVIGIGVMSISMVLALRLVWLESLLGGLDKSYRLHKWLGITGLIAVVLHWVAKEAPHWLTKLGLIEGGHRRGAGSHSESDSLNQVQAFLDGLHGPAKLIGEWAFYALIILITIALIKRFPYKIFVKTHSLIAVVYLALVFHAVALLDFASWSQPLGIVMGLLLIGGTISAVIVLTGQLGKRRKVEGAIETQHYFPKMKVLETLILLKDGWKGHKSGQFAFVSFDKKEGQHPFTIASDWDANNPRIMFITKALGDYTNFLPEKLIIGDKVIIEGPYGCFTFNDTTKRQIWIGGGIGITPFIARMKHLAHNPSSQVIDLFHCASELEPEVLNKLTVDAAAANITLHVILDKRDGHLNGEKLREIVPEWKSASVWFCGPIGFGKDLQKDLFKNGLPSNRFHQELFSMR